MTSRLRPRRACAASAGSRGLWIPHADTGPTMIMTMSFSIDRPDPLLLHEQVAGEIEQTALIAQMRRRVDTARRSGYRKNELIATPEALPRR